MKTTLSSTPTSRKHSNFHKIGPQVELFDCFMENKKVILMQVQHTQDFGYWIVRSNRIRMLLLCKKNVSSPRSGKIFQKKKKMSLTRVRCTQAPRDDTDYCRVFTINDVWYKHSGNTDSTVWIIRRSKINLIELINTRSVNIITRNGTNFIKIYFSSLFTFSFHALDNMVIEDVQEQLPAFVDPHLIIAQALPPSLTHWLLRQT